ncbi:hypothetical protein [Bacillus benzoevorans]|uniref:Putative effector of murein hydrolase LrgA (UPF0299 family) n=1 Tax=Bacillus benzoevorans TaxID=1456 RepID=A0A7X0HQD4_9BACI|nr:hypothetical protein [Bacillus benzoevorans]MBB6444994.1 putative effector of murein hydrolase LrgA (UPF0299 family) [Bacillus benzoevorans]
MFLPYVLSFFLYFPENKMEYIPALLKLMIMVLIAVLVMKVVVNWSKREEKKAKELEERLKLNAREKDS